MAHLNDGTLRRMLDDPDAITAPDREHFSTCPECKARQEALGADARQAAALLALPATTFDAGAAFKQITAQRTPGAQGISGDGAVFNLTFTAKAKGTGAISIAVPGARNSKNQPMEVLGSQSTVTVN